MAQQAKITTPFPSVLETATRLGVSKHDALVLSEMAERSEKSGVFAIPGVGRLIRVKGRKGRITAKGKAVRTRAANKTWKLQMAKSPNATIIVSKQE